MAQVQSKSLVSPLTAEAVETYIQEQTAAFNHWMEVAYNATNKDVRNDALANAHAAGNALATLNAQQSAIIRELSETAQEALNQVDALNAEIDRIYDEEDERINELSTEMYNAEIEHLLTCEDCRDNATVEFLAGQIMDRSMEDVTDEHVSRLRRQLKRAHELAQRKAEYGDESTPYEPDEGLTEDEDD